MGSNQILLDKAVVCCSRGRSQTRCTEQESHNYKQELVITFFSCEGGKQINSQVQADAHKGHPIVKESTNLYLKYQEIIIFPTLLNIL